MELDRKVFTGVAGSIQLIICLAVTLMSAYGYKRTYSGQLENVRFTPESGHSNRDIA